MKIKILRGTNEIGGSCVELKTETTTILIDYGTALSKNNSPVSTDKKIDAVLISHPHQDHYGDIEYLPEIPIYCSKRGHKFMDATRIFTGKEIFSNTFRHFKAWDEFTIGDFTIKAFLVDHSSMEAYAFLVKAGNKSVLYSGDFRAHGRKNILFDKICKSAELQHLDALILEGTMMQRSNDAFRDETSVEEKIYTTITANDNLSFLISSSQNIDRIVSAYRACVRAKKYFVVDLYTAWILELASSNIDGIVPKIPNISWEMVKVFKKFGGGYYKRMLERSNYFGNFMQNAFKDTVSLEEIQQNPSKFFLKISPFHIERILENLKIQNSTVMYSQWIGYLQEKHSDAKVVSCFKTLQNNSNWIYAHTSGHADIATLKTFICALKPQIVIPIHTEHKETFKDHFDKVRILDDGEEWEM